jgi:hypothetical protein
MMTIGSLRRAVCAAAFLGAVAYAGPAHAALYTVDSVGDTFDVLFNGNVDGQNVADLSAEATFVVTAFTGTSITFGVTLENTTGSLGSGLDSRVSSLAFDTTPNITSASSTGVFNIAVLGGSYPNQFGDIEACFKDGGGLDSCQGGGNGGVVNPNSGVFTLVLNFTGSITELAFDRFGVRYQSIDGAGFTGASGTGEGHIPDDPTTVLPEPTSMVLLGTGLLGLVRKLRRA